MAEKQLSTHLYDTSAEITSTGSANAYVIAISDQLNAYHQGMTPIRFKANFSCTGSATANIVTQNAPSGLGAVTLKKEGGVTDLGVDDIISGGIYTLAYDGTNFQVLELNAPAGGAGAPDDVEYVVAASSTGLTAERVATDTATVDVDMGTAGQAKWNVLEVPGIAATGLVARTAAATYTARTLTAPAAGITVSNGDGVSGNPTLALADDLAALEGMAGTGIVARTAAATYAQRTITGTSNEITVTNGDGVSGNPTLSIPATIDLGGKTSLEIPNSAAPTVDADGEIAVDTTVTDFSHGVLKYFGGEEMGVVAMPMAEFTTPTNGHVVAYNATNDEFELVAPAGAGSGFTSIVIQTFVASGTYTPTSGMAYCIVEVQAPGGGGGGGDSGNGLSRAGAGGGGGEYAKGVFSAATIGASQAVTIGAVGTAGANTGGNGGTGGTTSLGALITAIGGSGGTGSGSDSTDNTAGRGTGGTGGTGGSGGNFRIPGQYGWPMVQLYNGTEVLAQIQGRGGDSQMGFGGRDQSGTDTAGAAGQNYGGGGAGGLDNDTTGSAGGAGGAGIIIITEYIT